jgi:hypothetical protein
LKERRRSSRAGTESHIDAVSRHRLLDPGVAAKTRDLQIAAMVLEDAGFHRRSSSRA